MVYRRSHFILRNFGGQISVWDDVFQFGWVVKCFEFYGVFYDSSFVFGSTDFDPKFVAFFAARGCLLTSSDTNMQFL